MHETDVLMQMDEPMATLSVMQSAELLNYIKRMRSEGCSILCLARSARCFRALQTHSSHT